MIALLIVSVLWLYLSENKEAGWQTDNRQTDRRLHGKVTAIGQLCSGLDAVCSKHGIYKLNQLNIGQSWLKNKAWATSFLLATTDRGS